MSVRKKCAAKLLDVYARLRECRSHPSPEDPDLWPAIQEGFAAEWNLFKEKLAVIAAAASDGDEQNPPEND